ncbi:MAG: hypothetical protein CBC13_01905 [Planctomycetia bacterium TMED53]|nr:MAG: hypothetical protein CBC13_01905 [Planctomycetia bacterium TMED53]
MTHGFLTPVWTKIVPGLILATVLLAPTAASGQSLGRGPLTMEETRFVGELLGTYGSPDLARVWIESRIKSADSGGRATLEFALADALRIEGDVDGYEAEIQRLAKKYPNHPRAKGAQLESVLAALLRLSDANTEMVFATSPAQRQQSMDLRDRIWNEEIEKVLSENIRRLNDQVSKTEDKVIKASEAERDELAGQLGEETRIRDLWEFNRLNAYKIYAAMLPDGSEASQEKYVALANFADEFVNSRYENFGRRYEAQLIYGQALSAAGQAEEAAMALELLVDIEPSADPPYSDDVIFFIRQMRIEALTGSLRAYNRAGQPQDGLDLLDFLYEDEQPDFPYRSKPESPELATLVALLDVEEGVTRLASGDRPRGFELIRGVIEQFDNSEAYSTDPAQAREIVTGVNRGLSRLQELGAGNLPAEFYARAALGFRDRGLPETSIETAKLALYAEDSSKQANDWRAEALYEIGESSDALGRSIEAALAYQELAENYPESRMVAMAAQNFFAISGDMAAPGESGPWNDLLVVAEKLFADNSAGLGSEQLKLQQAVEAELEGDYRKARDLFRRISKTYTEGEEEKLVPFFFRARAGAARCLFRSSSEVDQARKDASGEILPLLAQAREARSVGGESVLRYELAKLHWGDRGKDAAEAIKVLNPVLTVISGNNVYREGALLFLLEILSSEGKTVESETILAELRKVWPDSQTLVAGTYYLIEAYAASSSEENRRRAGELVLDWIRLPGSGFEESGPGVRLGLASILIDGGFSAEAAEMLSKAQEEALSTGDQSLVIGVSFFLAKAANAAGKNREALDSLNDIIENYEDLTYGGSYNEAPFVLIQRASAELGLYQADRSAKRLTSMSEDLQAAIAILDQRRKSLLFSGGTNPVFERDYWSAWLQYMEVLKAQDRCEDVVQLIRSRRLMAGDGKDFAPADLQARFDRLEKDCK